MMRDQFHEIERARSALWSLDPGSDRDTWVRHAMGAKAAGLEFDDFHNWSAGAGNYQNETECRSVWNSIKPGGVTAASLFRAAIANGWKDEGIAPQRPPQSRQNERTPLQTSKPQGRDAKTLWEACRPAPADHSYIARKLGLPDGLRVYSGALEIARTPCDGMLVLPCFTLDGDMASLQFVPPQGKKLWLPGAKLPPDACLIIGGKIKPDSVCYIVEGIGQAWSAHQATRAPAVVCFGWGRVAGVVKALRERFPQTRFVLVPDVGKEPQAAEIARSIAGAWVELPADLGNNGDINDLHQRDGLKAVTSLLEQTKEAPQRFQLLTPADLGNLPPVQWRVRGVLPAEGIAAIFGPSGSGKSFLTLDLLATIASGGQWFGCRVKQAPVLYIALEGEAGISQRVKAFESHHGAVAAGFRFMLQSFDIRSTDDRTELTHAIHAAGWIGGVLCFDTLNRAAPGMDENDSKSMGEVIGAAKALQAELGGLILLVHHTGKDVSKGLRGHSSLHAALDAAVEVSREGERREWRMHKAKDGEDGEAHPFRLSIVEIGTDDEGEPLTSCIIAPEESTGAVMRRALPPKSGNQRIVWDALQDVLKNSPHYGQAGAPQTRPCVKLEDAIERTRGRLVCDSKRQTERTQAAITGLVSRGLLEHREGWLWIA